MGARNALKREQFLHEVAAIPLHKRVYVDQSGVDNTLTYAWGWSRKGQPCHAQRLGHKTARVSMMAALCQGQLLAPLTFQGTCYATLVEWWFEHQLLPELQEGQVVILDNAAFHRHTQLRAIVAQKRSWRKSDRGAKAIVAQKRSWRKSDRGAKAIVAQKGCTLLPLPPYSPDLNPIEHQWNALKIRIALDTNQYDTFQHKVDAAFL